MGTDDSYETGDERDEGKAAGTRGRLLQTDVRGGDMAPPSQELRV